MKEETQDFIAGAIAALAIYTLIGFIVGIIAVSEGRMSGKQGCTYRSFMAFINPGYLAACELWKVRFNQETPIEFQVKEKKVIK